MYIQAYNLQQKIKF